MWLEAVIKMGKGKGIGLLAAAVMIFSMGGNSVSASNPTLAALGDSLSTGYGLADYGVYPNENKAAGFVAQTASKIGYSPVNLAVDGLTSQQLLEGLKSLEEKSPQYRALAEAEVITVTIGGNDILNALYNQLGSGLGLVLSSPDFKNQVSAGISRAFSGLEGDSKGVVEKIDRATARFQQEATQLTLKYGENLSGIVERLKDINPQGILAVQTIPNLYFGVPGVGAACDLAVKAFNNQITDYGKKLGYETADVYTSFEASYLKSPYLKLTNALSPKTFMDPHPNAVGHELMARVTLEVLKAKGVKVLAEEDSVPAKEMVSLPLVTPFAKPPLNPKEAVDKALDKLQVMGEAAAEKWYQVIEKRK